MNEKKLFISFLKRNRIYRRFLKNCDIPIDKLCIAPILFVTGAFVFYETEEGHDYWANINMKWLAYLKKKQDEKKGNIHRGLSGAKG